MSAISWGWEEMGPTIWLAVETHGAEIRLINNLGIN